MYKIGEKVVYGTNGVFEIEDVREENVLGETHKYYVMRPAGEKRESFVFVPVDNEALTSQMRYPITKKNAEKLIKEIPDIPAAEWKKDSKQRTDNYKKLIGSANHRDIISVIKSVWLNCESRKNEGKKAYVSDESMIKRAEAILYSELAASLGIPECEVADYISAACRKNK